MTGRPQPQTPGERMVEREFGKTAEALLREFYAARWTQEEIADELGVSRMTVYRWSLRYGLERRRRQAATGRSWPRSQSAA